MKPPQAKRIPHPHVLHGDVRLDDYYWLQDKTNPDTIEYLEKENAYYEEHLAPLADLVDSLNKEMIRYIPETDQEVPVQHGPFYYYSRIESGQQYRVYCRKAAENRDCLDGAMETVLLDVNELAQDSQYLSVSMLRLSPDHTKLAYLENRDGTDRYTLYVKDLASGVLLPDRIENIFLSDSLAWDGTGRFVFYIEVDDSQRSYRLRRHELGTDCDLDPVLFTEKDPTFSVGLTKSRSGHFLFLTSKNKETDEVWFLPTDTANGQWICFEPRQTGVQYQLEHWNESFLILTNRNAPNFRVQICSLENRDNRRDLFAYHSERYITDVFPFEQAVLVGGRENGLTQVWIFRDPELTRLDWKEELYSVHVGANLAYDVDEVLMTYESLVTPRITYALSLATGLRVRLKQQKVPGDYNPSIYRQARHWTKAMDGTMIPVSLLFREGTIDDKRPSPLILYGYGSYGISIDDIFDPLKVPLLDRGIVFATAHVRGGAEMGYPWYQDGKLLNKRHTFTDFVEVAQDLIQKGYTTPNLLAARGRSAGGLLMGAIANMAPDLFQVIVPGVPFVDVVTTMLDESIPLTTLEWDEWGNPHHEEFYFYMKSYSPYDNIENKNYPHMLAITGLNDPRVGYWEPAKWVARLRRLKTDSHTLLLKTHMGAGHGGSSGRYARIRENAEEFAFVVDKLGANKN